MSDEPRRIKAPASETGKASTEQVLNALSNLNRINANITHTRSDHTTNLESVLALIVENAVQIVAGASAIIYTYDHILRSLTSRSRSSAGEKRPPGLEDQPRLNGMGYRAIQQKRRILSYEERDISIHPSKISAGVKTVACFPMIISGEILGVLYVCLHEDGNFKQLDLLLLENFINHAAMAIYHARLIDEVQHSLSRKEEELVRLRHAGLLISSRPGLKETLATILNMALEVTDAQYGCFRLVDKEAKNLVIAAISGKELGQPRTENLPIDTTSIMGWVAVHRQVLIIQDVGVDPWRKIYYPLDHDLEIRSELAVPLIGASGRLEGVLNIESPVAGAFHDDDSHLLQSLATQAIIAIQEASLMDALLEVASRLLDEPCDQILMRLSELACSLLNGAAGEVWLLDNDCLVLKAENTGKRIGDQIPLHNSLTGQAISNLSPITSLNVQNDPQFYNQDIAQSLGWTRALIVPLVTLDGDDRNPIGTFNVYSSEPAPGRFTESDWDKKVLTILAHYATLAVQNAARQENMRAAQDQRMITETFAAIGDVAVNLLHHINNKFGTIPVRIQGIQDKCQSALAGDPYLASNIAEIENSAHEAMTAVRENLSLLRPIRLETVKIAECVDFAAKASSLPANIQVHSVGLDTLPSVLVGSQSLVMVFTNLFENANDAMQGRGEIYIQAQLKNHFVEIIFTDTGPGIPPQVQDQIFELHFSGSKAYKGKLGFGLWWVKTLMTRLGGSIKVESDGKSGTSFYLNLPFEIEEINKE